MIGLLDPSFVGAAAFYPLSLPFNTLFNPNYGYYSNNGTTLAVDGATVQLGKNQRNAGASLNLSQSTAGSRMTYRVGANSVAWLQSTGGMYDTITIPAGAGGLCTAHLIKWNATGSYFNLYEDNVSNTRRIWIDSSGGIEPNGITAITGYSDGNWHALITYFSAAGAAKVWVDGTLKGSVSGIPSGTNVPINLFNRGAGTGWQGGVGCFGFGSFDPTSYVTNLSTWLLANKPT